MYVGYSTDGGVNICNLIASKTLFRLGSFVLPFLPLLEYTTIRVVCVVNGEKILSALAGWLAGNVRTQVELDLMKFMQELKQFGSTYNSPPEPRSLALSPSFFF